MWSQAWIEWIVSLFPRVEGSITQGHKLRVRGGKFKRDVRGRFFTQRVVNAWNALPEEVVEADSITTFKRHLDRYTNRQGREGYGPCRGKKILNLRGICVGTDLVGQRACSCALLFFVLCSFFQFSD